MSDVSPRRRIPANFVLLLYDYLDERGEDSVAILRHDRPPESVSHASNVAIEHWTTLLRRASTHLTDPHLGLHLGQTATTRYLGILGYVIMASRTLSDALTRLHRYQRLIYDVTPMEVRSRGTDIELVWDAEHGRPGPLVDETAITGLVRFCRSLCDHPVHPERVDFINPTPDDPSPYKAFFDCPVRFGQPETVVRFQAAVLNTPVNTADPGILGLMEQQADAMLATLPRQAPLVDNVRRRITQTLPNQEPHMAGVAKALGLSPRTLQRRMENAGTSFRTELASVRQQLAEQYLRESRLDIVDIALLLGYSEHSALTRSFIRWTDQTPQQYRKNHHRD